MLPELQQGKIRKAFKEGSLKVLSMSSLGVLEWKPINKVHRNEVPWEKIYRINLKEGSLVVTGGHRVYTSASDAIEVEQLEVGAKVQTQNTEEVIISKVALPARQFMYDLTVADNHNLILYSSKALVHNCPDKFYHFRPPEHEGNIGQYDRVFGQIWQDDELNEYCERALDWYNMFPPYTGHNIPTIDRLVSDRPAWRTAILWGAISHACFALSINWVAEEFSVVGDTEVTVHLSDGRSVSLPIKDLYEICQE
jgi:hypothetical protein